ncbi:MAG: hypothetical protein GY866_09435 [Proteobacteria bacterium]|nr:hypothetical protein [Pseudomonadota bacterium]
MNAPVTSPSLLERVRFLSEDELAVYRPKAGDIIGNLPNDAYHSFRDVVSSTGGKTIDGCSIKHWQDGFEKGSKSMSFGDDFHGVLESGFTGRSFMELSCVIDDYAKNRKEEVVKFILSFEQEHLNRKTHDRVDLFGTKIKELRKIAVGLEDEFAQGRKKVTESDYDRALDMKKALQDHPDVGKLFRHKLFLENGISEVSFFFNVTVRVDGQDVDILCKIRCDRLIVLQEQKQVWIVDWKSIGEPATRKNVKKAIKKYGYCFSGGMYQYGVQQFTDLPVYFFLVFAESYKPAKEKIHWMRVKQPDLNKGYEKFMDALYKLADYRLNGGWSGLPLSDTGYHEYDLEDY